MIRLSAINQSLCILAIKFKVGDRSRKTLCRPGWPQNPSAPTSAEIKMVDCSKNKNGQYTETIPRA